MSGLLPKMPNMRDLTRALRFECFSKMEDWFFYTPSKASSLVFDKDKSPRKYHRFRNGLAKWASSESRDIGCDLKTCPDNAALNKGLERIFDINERGAKIVRLETGQTHNAWFGFTWKNQLTVDDHRHYHEIKRHLNQIFLSQLKEINRRKSLAELARVLSERVYNQWNEAYTLASDTHNAPISETKEYDQPTQMILVVPLNPKLPRAVLATAGALVLIGCLFLSHIWKQKSDESVWLAVEKWKSVEVQKLCLYPPTSPDLLDYRYQPDNTENEGPLRLSIWVDPNLAVFSNHTITPNN